MVLLAFAAGPGAADSKFEAFIQSLWPRAKAAGISRSVFDQAFAGITDPDPDVLKLATISRSSHRRPRNISPRQ